MHIFNPVYFHIIFQACIMEQLSQKTHCIFEIKFFIVYRCFMWITNDIVSIHYLIDSYAKKQLIYRNS